MLYMATPYATRCCHVNPGRTLDPTVPVEATPPPVAPNAPGDGPGLRAHGPASGVLSPPTTPPAARRGGGTPVRSPPASHPAPPRPPGPPSGRTGWTGLARTPPPGAASIRATPA